MGFFNEMMFKLNTGKSLKREIQKNKIKCICCKAILKEKNSNYYCPFPDCPYYHLRVNKRTIKDTVKQIRRVKISNKDIVEWIKQVGKNNG